MIILPSDLVQTAAKNHVRTPRRNQSQSHGILISSTIPNPVTIKKKTTGTRPRYPSNHHTDCESDLIQSSSVLYEAVWRNPHPLPNRPLSFLFRVHPPASPFQGHPYRYAGTQKQIHSFALVCCTRDARRAAKRSTVRTGKFME